MSFSGVPLPKALNSALPWHLIRKYGYMKNFLKSSASVFVVLILNLSQSMAQTKSLYPEYLARADIAKSAKMTGYIEDNPLHPIQTQAISFLKETSTAVFLFSNSCSANFISSEGHALTALHCLSKFKIESVKGNIPLNLMFTPERSLIGQGVKIPRQKKMQFGLLDESPEFGDRVQILAMGKGFPNTDLLGKGALRSSYADLNGDWALVKFEKLPEYHVCAPAAVSSPNREDIVWAVGYPYVLDGKRQTLDWLHKGTPMFLTRFMREGADKAKLNKMLLDIFAFYRKIRHENSDPDPYLVRESFRAEHSRYLSVGRVYTDAKDLIKSTQWPVLGSSQLVDQIYDSKRHFVSTASIAGGMSGGGVFNTSGELIGINVSTLGGPAIYEDFRLGARHVSIKGIKEELQTLLSASEYEKAFNCRK